MVRVREDEGLKGDDKGEGNGEGLEGKDVRVALRGHCLEGARG